MHRGRTIIVMLVAAALIAATGASLAAARTAYVVGITSGGSNPYVVPVDLTSQTAGATISLPSGDEGGGGRIAITPDGTRAYAVASNVDQVVPIDTATNTAGAPIDVGVGPTAIAITPDGTRAYVVNRFDDSVTPIDLGTNAPLPEIAVGTFPAGIAITPDGTRAYVANRFSSSVSVIDVATNTVATTIAIAGEPAGAAATPDGSRIYVSEDGGDTFPIDVATNTVGSPIVGGSGGAIAIAPNGAKAYTADTFANSSVPLDLTSASAGTPIAVGGFPEDIAILPNASRAYVPAPDQVTDLLVPIDLATDQALPGFPVGENPEGIAIVPNQGPRASFSVIPGPVPAPGGATISSLPSVEFDAKASSDSDGSVARYDWDFGDGATAPNGGAAPTHIYSQPGTYTVTLTVTDNEGCSTAIVFPGQTAYCNGSSVARTTRTVTVGAPSCPTVKGSATSFVPKLRSSRVVPGVRVRLAVSTPARLVVTPTLIWSKDGDSGSAPLRKVNVSVDRWRRIRLALPVFLREKLPLGTPVKVKLRIAGTPRDASACSRAVTRRTLSLKVVKVIPNRAQSNPLP